MSTKREAMAYVAGLLNMKVEDLPEPEVTGKTATWQTEGPKPLALRCLLGYGSPEIELELGPGNIRMISGKDKESLSWALNVLILCALEQRDKRREGHEELYP